jgi:hypothetical protein
MSLLIHQEKLLIDNEKVKNVLLQFIKSRVNMDITQFITEIHKNINDFKTDITTFINSSTAILAGGSKKYTKKTSTRKTKRIKELKKRHTILSRKRTRSNF